MAVRQAQTTQSRHHDPVVQFSVFTENKVGRLNELIGLLGSHHVHVMALNTLDTTDSAIVRVIVDDPQRTRELFREHAFTYAENVLLAAELNAETDLGKVLAALLEAEININYLYPFIFRPKECAALAINVEDMDVSRDALQQRGIRVLNQSDISR